MEKIFYCFENNSIHLLRFYDGGNILIVFNLDSNIDYKQIPTWFQWEKRSNTPWISGRYTLNGSKFNFYLVTSEGKFTLSGKLLKNGDLALFSNSVSGDFKSTTIFKPYTDSTTHNISDTHGMESKPNLSNSIHQRSNSTIKKVKEYFIIFLIIMIMLTGCFTCKSKRRVGATCRDGTQSEATGSGACSWHEGVEHWNYEYKYWWDKWPDSHSE